MPPAAATRSRASRGSSTERSPAGRYEESDDCIVPRKPRTKPGNIGGGDGGGKAVGRRKGTWLRMSRTQSRNRHVTEAARPRIGAAWAAQAPMADHVRPSTGARCVSSARRDLCGGERGNLPPYRDHAVHYASSEGHRTPEGRSRRSYGWTAARSALLPLGETPLPTNVTRGYDDHRFGRYLGNVG